MKQETKSNEEMLFWCSRCHQKFQPMGEVLEWGKTYPEHKITKDNGEGVDPRFSNEIIKESREIKKALCKNCMIEVGKKQYDSIDQLLAEREVEVMERCVARVKKEVKEQVRRKIAHGKAMYEKGKN